MFLKWKSTHVILVSALAKNFDVADFAKIMKHEFAVGIVDITQSMVDKWFQIQMAIDGWGCWKLFGKLVVGEVSRPPMAIT
jgi:hypothetical protein